MKKHTATVESNEFNVLRWARQTAIADRRTYSRNPRPVSIQRGLRLLHPNLCRPIFIVGAPRSGTTFLGACLGELPEVSYHFEPVATKAASQHVYAEDWSLGRSRWVYRTVYRWLTRIHLDSDLRFAEKTPRNCFIIPFLATAFPDAQFIHIVRDGRDAALSYSKKPWLQAASAQSGKREPGGYAYGPYARFWVERDRISEFEATSDIHRCIWAWRRFTETALNAASSLPPHRYHELRYEQLVTHPNYESERLLNFLGIANLESRNRLKRAIAQARQDSVGQWQRDLSSEQLRQIEHEAGALLHELGYHAEEIPCHD
ncbi:MAG TPA: sulfotransferase family protein [Elainellaceae cyanobacterium]